VKKILKRVAQLIVLLLVVGVGGLVVKFYVLSPATRPAPNVRAPRTPEAIARGEYLANHVFGCTGCHSPVHQDQPGEPLVEGKVGSGRDFPDDPSYEGWHLSGPNLTPDRETGIGAWTDGEVLRAMREGVSRDGRPLFPMMPYTIYGKHVSDEDALAVIAYLRSLPAIENTTDPTVIGFPVSMFVRAAPQPVTKAARPAPASGLARGRWLLDVASCGDCHTTFDEQRNPIPGHYLAGGNPFPIPGRGTVYTPNVTSDRATGVGSYSDEDLRRAIFEGYGKDGRRLYGMPWWYYGGMNDEDKSALVAALRQVRAVRNLVKAGDLRRD
jgi:mono/diheme cytochrome c family protein